jgi:DNA-binding transcriptional MerR regulator
MTVNELAKRENVTLDTIRYYTKTGLLKPNRDNDNGYKRYSENDQRRLQFIVRAKTLGFSLSDIKQIFSASENAESPCELVRKMIRERIESNKKHMEEAMCLQKRMIEAERKWQAMPNALPTGHSICHLIESIT